MNYNNVNLLNNKEHRFIPYLIISLNNLFSYAGESYEKWEFQHKKINMKKILLKISDHGKRHFEVNSILLLKNENLNIEVTNNLLFIGKTLIDIRNWLFHPEQNQVAKIKRLCQKLSLDESSFFKIIWKIIACFLYKNELIQFIQELDSIYRTEKISEKNEILKLNFYSFSDSFNALIKNIDAYSSMCQQTILFLETQEDSPTLKKEWNDFLNFHYQYSNFVFDYDYFNKKLFILTQQNEPYLIIENLKSTNLKKLKISKLFYYAIINVQQITFEEFQSLDSGFITRKYKNLIKEIYKVLRIQKKFKEYRNLLQERLNQRQLLSPAAINFIKKIKLEKIRNQAFHFSYKKELEQDIYSQFFFLIAHLESEESKNQKIEEDLARKLNNYLEISQSNNVFLI